MRLKKYWREVVIAAVAVTPFIFHFLNGEIILSFDTTHLFYVMKRWYVDHWLRGEFPLWNPGIFTGYFQLASPAIAIFSPTTPIFYFLFKSVWAEELQLPLFAILAGLGFYRLALELVEDRDVALISGLGYALSGPLLSLTDRSSMFFSASLYPWFFVFGLRFFKNENQVWMATGVSFVIAMMMIHGDWTSALMCVLVLGVFVASTPQLLRRSLRLLPFIAAGFGLAMPSVLPTLSDVATTSRAHGFDFELASYFSLHPIRLLNLFAPELWGQPYANNFWGDAVSNAFKAKRFWFHSIYLGLPVLYAAFIGGWAMRKRRCAQALLGVLLLATLIAFGKHFLLHCLTFEWVRPYQKLRFPEKFFYYSIFATAVFAVWGFQQIKMRDLWKLWWRTLTASYAFLSLIDFLLSLNLTLEPASHNAMFKAGFQHLALALVFAALGFLFTRSLKAITASLILDLVVFAPVHHWFDAASMNQNGSISTHMNIESGRFVRDQSLDSFIQGAARSSLQPNLHILSGLESVFGYETSNPLRIERIVGPEVFRHLDIWAPILRIGYVISTQKPREKNLKSWFEKGYLRVEATDSQMNSVLLRTVDSRPSFATYTHSVTVETSEEALSAVLGRKPGIDLAILEQADWTPDASTEPPKIDVSPVDQTTDHHSYILNSNRPFIFVERENFHDGWQPRLDGQLTKLVRADFLNRAVFIPAGRHTLTLDFGSRAFTRGCILSVVSLTFLILALIFARLRRRQFVTDNKVFDDLGVT